MSNSNAARNEQTILGIAFLFSGTAGLMYQIAWQRILFSSFGIDIVSVSIIVSTFMLGLGLGALAGGWAGDRWPQKTLLMFTLCETGIGLFGIFSPDLIRGLGEFLPDANLGIMALANFLLIIVPTTLMGATLPILITYLVKKWKNIGKTTGHLYSINTLGAMLGAYVTSYVLFYTLELDQVIHIAAAINFGVAACINLYTRVRT